LKFINFIYGSSISGNNLDIPPDMTYMQFILSLKDGELWNITREWKQITQGLLMSDFQELRRELYHKINNSKSALF
jgi:hypothetical protein